MIRTNQPGGRAVWILFCCAVASLMLGGCCDKTEDTQSEASDDAQVKPLQLDPEEVVVHDLFSMVKQCDIYHRGAVMDLGSGAEVGRQGFDLFGASSGWNASVGGTIPGVFNANVSDQPGDMNRSFVPRLDTTNRPAGQREVTREGASWLEISTKSISLWFHQWQTEPVFVQARIRGLGARQALARIDGKVVGALRFSREQVQIVQTKPTQDPLEAGHHVLSLAFSGAKRDEASAEIDWIRVGTLDNDPTTFGAPTFRDIAAHTTIGGQPHRALALRGPGRVRCTVALSPAMRFQTSIGLSGTGQGQARIELVRNDANVPTKLLHATDLSSDGKSADTVDVSLEGLNHQLASIDLIAKSTSAGGRILFGDPRLLTSTPKVTSRPQAQVMVVVVLSGASRNQLPPYSEVQGLVTLSKIAQSAVTFYNHRAPTTTASGSVASLLTGLSAAQHRMTDPLSKLPQTTATIATAARDGRVTTAMFTGNPTTFEPFGLSRGWDRFVTVSPVSGQESNEPLLQARTWIDEQLKKDKNRSLLVVVHARAGHPPWTATAEQAKDLPPPEYAGNLNSRRGGQILAMERNRRFGRRPMPAQDRVRAQAFADLALVAEDKLLGELVQVLRHHKVWDASTLIVTSDIAMGGAGRIPFGDGEELGEDVLEIPLIVRFPQDRMQGARLQSATQVTDVARSILLLMGLQPPPTMQGRDLLEIATHPERFASIAQFALVQDSYATRWGDYLLATRSPKKPWLCIVGPSAPRCSEDLSNSYPQLFSWLWQQTLADVQNATKAGESVIREIATLDPETIAALTVWGNLEPEPTKK